MPVAQGKRRKQRPSIDPYLNFMTDVPLDACVTRLRDLAHPAVRIKFGESVPVSGSHAPVRVRAFYVWRGIVSGKVSFSMKQQPGGTQVSNDAADVRADEDTGYSAYFIGAMIMLATVIVLPVVSDRTYEQILPLAFVPFFFAVLVIGMSAWLRSGPDARKLAIILHSTLHEPDPTQQKKTG